MSKSETMANETDDAGPDEEPEDGGTDTTVRSQIERGNARVSGELDMGYTSYWNPEKHGSMTQSDEDGDEPSASEAESAPIEKEEATSRQAALDSAYDGAEEAAGDPEDDETSDPGTSEEPTMGARGTTIGGTTADDFGTVQTETWPSHIDPTAVPSPEKREAIKAAATLPPTAQQGRIAEFAGVSAATVSRALREFWPDHDSIQGPHDTDSSDGSEPGSDEDEPSKSEPENEPESESETDADEAGETSGWQLVPNGNTTEEITPAKIDEFRLRMMRGEEGLQDLAEEIGVTNQTIHNAVTGTTYQALSDEVTLPPIQYESGTGWVPTEATFIQPTDGEAGAYISPGALGGEGAAADGAGSAYEAELLRAIDAIRETATADETITAMGYLQQIIHDADGPDADEGGD